MEVKTHGVLISTPLSPRVKTLKKSSSLDIQNFYHDVFTLTILFFSNKLPEKDTKIKKNV